MVYVSRNKNPIVLPFTMNMNNNSNRHSTKCLFIYSVDSTSICVSNTSTARNASINGPTIVGILFFVSMWMRMRMESIRNFFFLLLPNNRCVSTVSWELFHLLVQHDTLMFEWNNNNLRGLYCHLPKVVRIERNDVWSGEKERSAMWCTASSDDETMCRQHHCDVREK